MPFSLPVPPVHLLNNCKDLYTFWHSNIVIAKTNLHFCIVWFFYTFGDSEFRMHPQNLLFQSLLRPQISHSATQQPALFGNPPHSPPQQRSQGRCFTYLNWQYSRLYYCRLFPFLIECCGSISTCSSSCCCRSACILIVAQARTDWLSRIEDVW